MFRYFYEPGFFVCYKCLWPRLGRECSSLQIQPFLKASKLCKHTQGGLHLTMERGKMNTYRSLLKRKKKVRTCLKVKVLEKLKLVLCFKCLVTLQLQYIGTSLFLFHTYAKNSGHLSCNCYYMRIKIRRIKMISFAKFFFFRIFL